MSIKSSDMSEILAPESIIMGACMPLIVPSVTKSSSKLLIGVGKVSQEETAGAGSDLLSSTFLTCLALVLGTGTGRFWVGVVGENGVELLGGCDRVGVVVQLLA